MPIFIKKLVSYKGTLFTKYGFWLVLYTMARTKEIRFSVWEEFTLDDQNPLKHTLVFTVTGDMVMIVTLTLTLSVTGEVKRKNIDNSQYC